MSFKNYQIAGFSLCLLLSLLLRVPFCFSEFVDCVAAVVNDQIITLTDIRVLEAFGFYEKEMQGNVENPLLLILERAIDQKVVIDLAQEKVSIEKEEVEASLASIMEKFGIDEIQRKLDEFGLDRSDLKGYLEEKLLYQKIISLRFSQSVIVSLKEIETYYTEVYVPSQENLGLKPKPMVEVLDEIESQVKGDKVKKQVAAWIENLRRQAEIQVKDDCLKQK